MRRTVQGILIGVAILALAAPAIADNREFEINNDDLTGGHAIFLDRAGKMCRGQIEIPQPPPVLLFSDLPGSSGKLGAAVQAVSLGTRSGGMTRTEKAEVGIRALIRKLG